MFCSNCGSQIDDNASICPHCGVATKNYKPEEQKNVLALVGFILSFVVAIAGLVCSIIAYKKADELNGNGKAFARAGIIISAVELVLEVVAIIILISVYATIWTEIMSHYPV